MSSMVIHIYGLELKIVMILQKAPWSLDFYNLLINFAVRNVYNKVCESVDGNGKSTVRQTL